MNKYFKGALLVSLATASLNAELVITNFDTGEVKKETNYIDGTNTDIKVGIKNGIEKVYYQMGRMAYQVNYIEDKRDGILEWFDKEGNKLSEIYYKLGKITGEEKSFYPNKQVKHTVTYVNDLKEGIQKEYFSTGTLAQEVNYTKGKKNGLQKEYTDDGNLYTKVNYINNYKEGLQKWYDKHSKVIRETLFKQDRPVEIMKQVQRTDQYNDVLSVTGIDFSPQKPE
ncbi:toxin-antitoxin system YwqK family antitoxin [Sulfurimonas sp. SAG-AH-194-I05]|nr:toxin-antitoxin system YwqK family antitoxin [Sulfurimonas sp. SAG-AH-194-I05]MDF1874359.1 toxin-antitoxin system YwqK family antitoxin [Sulfurimonas sp. SAG-AH-194-I05]